MKLWQVVVLGLAYASLRCFIHPHIPLDGPSYFQELLVYCAWDQSKTAPPPPPPVENLIFPRIGGHRPLPQWQTSCSIVPPSIWLWACSEESMPCPCIHPRSSSTDIASERWIPCWKLFVTEGEPILIQLGKIPVLINRGRAHLSRYAICHLLYIKAPNHEDTHGNFM